MTLRQFLALTILDGVRYAIVSPGPELEVVYEVDFDKPDEKCTESETLVVTNVLDPLFDSMARDIDSYHYDGDLITIRLTE